MKKKNVKFINLSEKGSENKTELSFIKILLISFESVVWGEKFEEELIEWKKQIFMSSLRIGIQL